MTTFKSMIAVSILLTSFTAGAERITDNSPETRERIERLGQQAKEITRQRRQQEFDRKLTRKTFKIPNLSNPNRGEHLLVRETLVRSRTAAHMIASNCGIAKSESDAQVNNFPQDEFCQQYQALYEQVIAVEERVAQSKRELSPSLDMSIVRNLPVRRLDRSCTEAGAKGVLSQTGFCIEYRNRKQAQLDLLDQAN